MSIILKIHHSSLCLFQSANHFMAETETKYSVLLSAMKPGDKRIAIYTLAGFLLPSF